MEFLESIDLVVESEGTYVDLNVRNGRRLLNFGSVSDTMKNRLRPTRTKEASMASLEDLHPDATASGAPRETSRHFNKTT